MSKRNSRENKAKRRAEREKHHPSVDVMMLPHLHKAAAASETLPCGCDAHELLHGPGWQSLDLDA